MNGYEATVLPDPEDISLTGKDLDLREQRALDSMLCVTGARGNVS